jgi:predicted RNase H-like nuclease
MTIALVGFDSAWTRTNKGAQGAILKWQTEQAPTATIVLLDQPIIVENPKGQRPVENIVGSVVSRRRGGTLPANTSNKEMFGRDAPIWPFLKQFGGPANPLERVADTRVIETYPVLAMIALGWMLKDDEHATGRLPKYNPERRKTFSISDWQHVCKKASGAFREFRLAEIVGWIDELPRTSPRKKDQNGLDACLCLLVALYLAERKDCLMVGDLQTGYIVVPHGTELRAELDARCNNTRRTASEWVRVFHRKSPKLSSDAEFK